MSTCDVYHSVLIDSLIDLHFPSTVTLQAQRYAVTRNRTKEVVSAMRPNLL